MRCLLYYLTFFPVLFSRRLGKIEMLKPCGKGPHKKGQGKMCCDCEAQQMKLGCSHCISYNFYQQMKLGCFVYYDFAPLESAFVYQFAWCQATMDSRAPVSRPWEIAIGLNSSYFHPSESVMDIRRNLS